MNPLIKTISLGIALCASTSHAATFSFNDISSDDSSNLIVNSKHNIDYLRLDVLADLTYEQTVAITSAGGEYEDFKIAGIAQVEQFWNALFGDNNCVSGAGSGTGCGVISGWSEGDFGGSYYVGSSDVFWYLSDDNSVSDIGYGYFNGNGSTYQYEEWSSIAASNTYSSSGSNSSSPIGMLVYRNQNASSVPEPSVIALMGIGYLGFSFAKRREQLLTES